MAGQTFKSDSRTQQRVTSAEWGRAGFHDWEYVKGPMGGMMSGDVQSTLPACVGCSLC